MDNCLVKECLIKGSSIDCLPDEIIEKICLYLDLESLKCVSCCQKRCAHIIDNSTMIWRNFVLSLTDDFWKSEEKLHFLLHSHRKYNTIELADAIEAHCSLTKVFQQLGNQLRTLKISKSQIDDLALCSMLKSSPLLEKLFLSEVTIERRLPIIIPVNIFRLRSLTVHHCDWIIFQLLLKAKINRLEVYSYDDEGNREYLVHFLAQQFKLKNLTLYGTSSRFLFRKDDVNKNSNIDLVTFHIDRIIGKNSHVVDCNIIDFLSANKETLTNIDVVVPNCVYISDFILTHIKSLTSLTLDVGSLPKNDEFFYRLSLLEPNMQLVALKLCGLFRNLNLVSIILTKYPAIKRLELNNCNNTTSSSDLLKFICVHLPHLQQLHVPEITNGCDVTFNELKHLSVTYISDTQNFIKFLTLNRSIERLNVGSLCFEQNSSTFIVDLMCFKHVQYLSLGGSDEKLRTILDIISTNSLISLKILELISCDNGPSLVSRKTIKLFFPLNKCDFEVKLKSLFTTAK